MALAQANLVGALLMSGQQARAWQMGQASLRYYRDAGNMAGCADALEAMALCAAAEGDCEKAVRWAGAAAIKRVEINVPRTPYVRDALARGLAGCSARVEAVTFDTAVEEAMR
jgi:hypothetical protein